jgi:hypothetical protein
MTPEQAAAFERVRIAALDLTNVLREFPHADSVDPSSDLGKLIAFFRNDFGDTA